MKRNQIKMHIIQIIVLLCINFHIYTREYFDNPINYSNNTFEILEIDNLEISKDDLTNQPDVLLINMDEDITEEMKYYSRKNLTQIVRTTDANIGLITSSDVVLSFSS